MEVDTNIDLKPCRQIQVCESLLPSLSSSNNRGKGAPRCVQESAHRRPRRAGGLVPSKGTKTSSKSQEKVPFLGGSSVFFLYFLGSPRLGISMGFTWATDSEVSKTSNQPHRSTKKKFHEESWNQWRPQQEMKSLVTKYNWNSL